MTFHCSHLCWCGRVALFRACRYASLYFITFVDREDNELLALEVIHHYVEILDRYFGNVRSVTSV